MRSPPIPLPVAECAHQAAVPEPAEPLAKVVRHGIENRRPEAVAQRKLAAFVQNSPRVVAQARREAALRGEPVQRTGPQEEELLQGKLAPVQRTGPEEEELLQGKFAPVQRAEPKPDREPSENKTGLPDNLKSGIESLSGISLDNVKVHYNSAQPAQLNALAYAQGNDIHVAPGQERHLPHEAWHVAQQNQERVEPTMQAKGVAINDDQSLEREADLMGAKAAHLTAPAEEGRTTQRKNDLDEKEVMKPATVQRAVGFEFQTYQSATDLEILKESEWKTYSTDVEERYAQGNAIKVEKDGQDIEFVTNAFAESDTGRTSLTQAMRTIVLTGLNLENSVTPTADIWRMASGLSIGPEARDKVRVNSQGPMKAQPQATVGVKLDSLTNLLEFLSNAPKRETSQDLAAIYETEATRPDARKKMVKPEQPKGGKKPQPLAYHKVLANELGHNVYDVTQKMFHEYVYPMAQKLANLASTPPLKGFVNLLGLYIFGGAAKSKYAKSRTPIISRTNLADVFAKLSGEDQLGFFKKFLPQASDFLGQAKIKIEGPVYPSYPHGELEASGIGEKEVMKMTIVNWLTNLAPEELGGTGTDILSGLEGLGVISNVNNVRMPDPEDYHQKWFSDAYGADLQMQASTDIGTRELLDKVGIGAHRLEGVVLELRNLGDDQLDLSEWPSFALSLFDLILLVNSSTMREVKALSEAMLRQRSFETDLGDLPAPGIFAEAREILAKNSG